MQPRKCNLKCFASINGVCCVEECHGAMTTSGTPAKTQEEAAALYKMSCSVFQQLHESSRLRKTKKKTVIEFPTYNISLGDAVLIVKEHLYDENIAIQSKVLAIEHVANMETHNCISKNELIQALRWLFEHYEF